MVLKNFTVPEIDYFLEYCNFTEKEREFFLYRTKDIPLEEICDLMNFSRRTAGNYSKRVKDKIEKIDKILK